ncbi:MAG: YceH family protein [Planctomycetes bacterium]|nr:YceH family protein [Planctomycetota bacterium]
MAVAQEQEKQAPQWRPLSSHQRRILGVLVEKAKTTPNAYPITLNALTTGCNQKSNREPQMELAPDQVESALEQLREWGAVGEIQGDGRVPKYRHYLYEWLGVDKVELSVMAELLLRGEQTVGELRGRAARMDPIDSLETLRPILQSLIEKNLVVSLTPEGRGQVVAHNLYPQREMEELRRRFAGGGSSPPRNESRPVERSAAASAPPDVIAELRVEVAELRAAVARLREEVRQMSELRDTVAKLEHQLGELMS